MQLKKLLTMGLAGTLLVGTIATSSAAELDYAWYAKQNPDVVAAVGDSPEALQLHYDMYGRKEARMANTKDVEAQLRRLFNVEEYAKLYPDVKEFYGEDAEAMFMHYLSYGLLEARRPSEKVSQAAATSLKKAVEKAMTDAGLEATPGSVELVAVITGESAALAAAKPELVLDSAKLEEVTKALEQVAAVVEKAVAETVKEVANPAPAPSSGGGSSAPAPAATPSPSPSSSPNPTQTPDSSPTPSPTATPSTVTVTDSKELRAAVGVSGNDDIVKLESSISLSANEALVVKRDVTLDLNGKNLSGVYPTLIYVEDGKKLTIRNGVIESNTTENNVVMISVESRAELVVESGVELKPNTGAWAIGVGSNSAPAVNAKVTMDGSITRGVGGLTINGTKGANNNQITINGSITTSDVAVYLAGVGEATVGKNASLKGGNCGIEIRAGKLTIDGGIIESNKKLVATGEGCTVKANDSGRTVDGAALAVSQHTTKEPIEVIINGGTFTAKSGGVALFVTDIQQKIVGSVKVKIPNSSTATFNAEGDGAKSMMVHFPNASGAGSSYIEDSRSPKNDNPAVSDNDISGNNAS